MNKLYKLQSLVLLIGTLFAWFTVYSDFSRFYGIYGSLTRIQNCLIPNPVTTPCFYGAFVFLAGFIWSLFILKRKIEDRFIQQKRLNLLLIAGTVFAWGNFAYETIKFYLVKSGPKLSCSGVPTDNIIFTSCFYGSVLFLLSLIVSIIIRVSKKTDH
jgi:hypothetical protein